jgi:ABC-type Mn2+/Zn2+ transport system permease subunit
VVLAYRFGLPLPLGAFASGLLCTWATGWIRRHSRIKPDTVLGVVFTGLFALGLVLHAATPSELHLNHILFGNLLGLEREILHQGFALGALVLGLTLALRREFLLIAFDPAQARALGLRVQRWDTVLLALLALAVVATLQAVGLILVIALLVTPGATALLLTRRFDRALCWAIGSAVVSVGLGLMVSFHASADPAACIVLAQSLGFAAALAIAAQRRRRLVAKLPPAQA